MEKKKTTIKAPKDKELDPMKAKLNALNQALGNIEKNYGRGAIMKLGDENIEDVEVIPTGSIGLNYALGVGGYPRGRIIEIFGPESSGKTTLAIHAIAEAQKAGGIAAIIDAEHAFDRFYAEKLGVDVNNLFMAQPDNGEQALDIAEQLIRADPQKRNRRRHGRQERGRTGPPHVTGHEKADRHNLPHQHHLHLHQPAAREDRRDVRSVRDNHRRQRPQILRLCPNRHPSEHSYQRR